jgi:hypothetical protein
MAQSSHRPGNLRRQVLAGLAVAASAACGNDAAPLSNPGLTSLAPSGMTSIADGFQQILITATVDASFGIVNSSVSFATTEGSFTGGSATATVAANDSGLARVELKAPSDSSDATVTATVVGLTKSVTVHFLPAPPTWITVAASAYEVTQGIGNSVLLTATIGRAQGTPSSGTPIAFAYQVLGGGPLMGHLTGTSQFPTSSGSTAVSFVLDSGDLGAVRVIASATRGSSTVADTIQLSVVAKPTTGS